MVAIDGYRIFAELQRSSWVTIFKAFDARRNQTVLIKALTEGAAPASVREQLAVESDFSRRFSHPNLRRVFDSGVSNGQPYVVLEYVEGHALSAVIALRPPIELCAWIARQVARALSALHKKGVLHRDIKPQNIFVATTGEVKLGDLGLAVDYNDTTTNLAGTPAYLSPEVVLGKEVGAHSDLFSLGAVFYEMLTGEPPFADHTTSAILHRIANLEPTPVAKLCPKVPAELSALCHKLIAKDPAHRCQSADEVVAVLDRFERDHNLMTTAKNVAAFVEHPESYPTLHFDTAQVATAKPPVSKRHRSLRVLPMLVPALLLLGLALADSGAFRSHSSPPQDLDPAVSENDESEGTASANAGEKISAPAETQTEISPAAAESPVPLHARPPRPSPRSPRPRTVSPDTMRLAPLPGEQALERSLVITSMPYASVFAEQDSLGVTPLHWNRAFTDRVYELRFVSPGLPEVRKLVTLAILDSDTLRVDLWKEVGFLAVTVNPWGEIWIDGKPIDTTPLSNPLVLGPGLHELSIRHPRLGTQTQRVVVTRGDTLRKFFDMFPH